MTYRNYIIKYTAISRSGATLKSGKMRVKKKLSALEAQVKLEGWLKKKHPGFGRLIVHWCREDDILGGFFGDIFKK